MCLHEPAKWAASLWFSNATPDWAPSKEGHSELSCSLPGGFCAERQRYFRRLCLGKKSGRILLAHTYTFRFGRFVWYLFRPLLNSPRAGQKAGVPRQAALAPGKAHRGRLLRAACAARWPKVYSQLFFQKAAKNHFKEIKMVGFCQRTMRPLVTCPFDA